jgi:GntP family gluconate:H+ symporter
MWLLILLGLSIIFIVLTTTRWKLHPFLALLLAAFGYGILSGKMSLADVVTSVNTGFGGTIGYIGIVILAGSIIGTFLEKSGGAFALAERTVGVVGQKNVPLAMGIIGYIVSVPVFCDSGFIILSPLARAMSRRAGIPLAASAVALSLGLYATHTMVPPTPGPIAAAGILKADLGLVIIWGIPVSLVALAAGWLFAILSARGAPVDSQTPPDELGATNPDAHRPSALKAIVPILLPIVLIVLKSIADLPSRPFEQIRIAAFINAVWQFLIHVISILESDVHLPDHLMEPSGITGFISFVGQPVVALLLGVFLAFLLPKKVTREMLSTSGWVGEAVVAAATIIIITGSGGAFGKVLQNSGISDFITGHIDKSAGLSILLPFVIAAAVKTAQGSSTVAIITTAGIMAPLLMPLGLDNPTGRALAVVTIGAGSMVVSHVNDSYFWVVTGFSKMTVKEGYKYQTLGTLVEGCAAAGTLFVISLFAL